MSEYGAQLWMPLNKCTLADFDRPVYQCNLGPLGAR